MDTHQEHQQSYSRVGASVGTTPPADTRRLLTSIKAWNFGYILRNYYQAFLRGREGIGKTKMSIFEIQRVRWGDFPSVLLSCPHPAKGWLTKVSSVIRGQGLVVNKGTVWASHHLYLFLKVLTMRLEPWIFRTSIDSCQKWYWRIPFLNKSFSNIWNYLKLGFLKKGNQNCEIFLKIFKLSQIS